MPVQWVHLGADELLVASSRKAWIQYPEYGIIGLDRPMPTSVPGTTETTSNLLDGAIAAAERAARLVRPPPMTALRWAWELVNQWYISRHTIELLGEAAERYADSGRLDLAEFTSEKLDEERGDDELPLADLRALGYDAAAVVREVSSSDVAVQLIEYARSCVTGEHPVEFLGYAHAIERHAIRITPAWLAAVERVLPPGIDAVRGVRVHATDLDVQHVDAAIVFFAGLPACDRTRIALACHRTTELRSGCCAGRQPSEMELETWLRPFQDSSARHNREQQGASR